jgi:hypothetical protein
MRNCPSLEYLKCSQDTQGTLLFSIFEGAPTPQESGLDSYMDNRKTKAVARET